MTFAQEAKESLIEKFLDGGRVDGLIFRDLLNIELDQNYAWSVSEIESLILTAIPDAYNGSQKADQYARGLIEKFLASRPGLVTDLAAELREDYEESQRAA